jgi:hypothetical protein
VEAIVFALLVVAVIFLAITSGVALFVQFLPWSLVVPAAIVIWLGWQTRNTRRIRREQAALQRIRTTGVGLTHAELHWVLDTGQGVTLRHRSVHTGRHRRSEYGDLPEHEAADVAAQQQPPAGIHR